MDFRKVTSFSLRPPPFLSRLPDPCDAVSGVLVLVVELLDLPAPGRREDRLVVKHPESECVIREDNEVGLAHPGDACTRLDFQDFAHGAPFY